MSCRICRKIKCRDEVHKNYWKHLVYRDGKETFTQFAIEKYGIARLERVLEMAQHPLIRRFDDVERSIVNVTRKLEPLVKRFEDLLVEKAFVENLINETKQIEDAKIFEYEYKEHGTSNK